MDFISTQLSSLTIWNTFLRRILRGSEGLAGENLVIAAVDREGL